MQGGAGERVQSRIPFFTSEKWLKSSYYLSSVPLTCLCSSNFSFLKVMVVTVCPSISGVAKGGRWEPCPPCTVLVGIAPQIDLATLVDVLFVAPLQRLQRMSNLILNHFLHQRHFLKFPPPRRLSSQACSILATSWLEPRITYRSCTVGGNTLKQMEVSSLPEQQNLGHSSTIQGSLWNQWESQAMVQVKIKALLESESDLSFFKGTLACNTCSY